MLARALLGCSGLLALSLCAAPCGAEPCRVDAAASLGPEWRDAARRVDELGLTHEDCDTVQLEGVEAGVRLTFVTHDGRYAERLLTEASELRPTIEALRVTGNEQRSAADLPAGAPAIAEGRPSSPRMPPATPGSALALAIHLQGGVRAGAESLASPLVTGGASFLLDAWELGVLGAYEFHYARLGGDTSTDRGARALALGVNAGRREPLGAVTLLAGGRVSVAALEYRDVQNDSHAEGRAGAYVGVTGPRREPWRLRADLAADFVAAGAFRSTGRAGAPAPSITPAWAFTLLVGVDMNAF